MPINLFCYEGCKSLRGGEPVKATTIARQPFKPSHGLPDPWQDGKDCRYVRLIASNYCH